MKSNNTDVWETVLGVGLGCGLAGIVIIPIAIYGYVINGWVLSLLWLWFIVPVFHVVALTIPQSIGITMIVGFLTKQMTNDKGEEDKRTTSKKIIDFLVIIISPFLTLGIGWIVYNFFIVH